MLSRWVGELANRPTKLFCSNLSTIGVKFSASSPALKSVYYRAVRKLLDCMVPNAQQAQILQEGGVCGLRLESTATINAELCSRFIPSVAEATYSQFAALQREDGLLPYKITAEGAVFKQIQLVHPGQNAWNHYALHRNQTAPSFLPQMYVALSRYDNWLSQYRNTRGTGCVEAFCAFDTGHDLSPRFWHVPDTPHLNDPALVNPDSPILPFLAPDLTASVYCSRKYLGQMARELGLQGDQWREKAEHR